MESTNKQISSLEQLRELYRLPSEGVVLKAVDIIDDGATALIAASPFIVFATASENGLDCSPKGGEPGFVHVLDEKTLLLPDWSGNNRIDGLQNILSDPRVGIAFFYPGYPDVFRVNGRAVLSTDEALTSRFEHEGKQPKVVIVITVSEAFIHCGRAVTFGKLWDADARVPAESMPNLRDVVMGHIAYSREKKESSNEA
jgi:PPOX class probable FMN-dependent enzyme